MYQCPDCHKNLSSKHNLERHIKGVTCHKKDKTCPLCKKFFRRKESLQYHIKQNVCVRTKPKLVLRKEHAQLSRDQLIDRLAQTETELTHIKGKYEALKENPQHIVNNNQIVVFPTAFGSENFEHIQGKLGDILGPLIKGGESSYIPTLFNQIHNNKQLPEYHNVYTFSERSSYALVSDGTTFKYRPKKTIIDQIIEDKRSLLNHYVDYNGDQLGGKVLSKYEKYQNQIDENSEFRKELELEIGGLLLDMKSVIANDEKTRVLLDKVNEGQFEIMGEIRSPIPP